MRRRVPDAQAVGVMSDEDAQAWLRRAHLLLMTTSNLPPIIASYQAARRELRRLCQRGEDLPPATLVAEARVLLDRHGLGRIAELASNR